MGLKGLPVNQVAKKQLSKHRSISYSLLHLFANDKVRPQANFAVHPLRGSRRATALPSRCCGSVDSRGFCCMAAAMRCHVSTSGTMTSTISTYSWSICAAGAFQMLGGSLSGGRNRVVQCRTSYPIAGDCCFRAHYKQAKSRLVAALSVCQGGGNPP